MEKKSKPVRIEKKDQKDQYGNTSFVISFENGDRGFYTSKDEDQKKFIIGVESEYIIEEKIGKNSTKYFKVTLPQQENKFSGGGAFQKKSVDPKVQLAGFAAAYTKDLIVAGKVSFSDFEPAFQMIFNTMIKKAL
jgi:hypothetical protein